MARDKFFLSVRTAAGFLSPNVSSDSSSVDAATVERSLRKADIWLCNSAIDGYDPSDFLDLPSDRQGELRSAVDAFRAAVEKVPPDGPAAPEVHRAGLEAFLRIVAVVQSVLTPEWADEVRRLTREAQAWAERRGWPSRLGQQDLSDKVLGRYRADQLLVRVGNDTLLLKPIERFVPGTNGLMELALVPSYDSVTIPKTQSGWEVRIPAGRTFDAVRRLPWSEEAFVEAANFLRQSA